MWSFICLILLHGGPTLLINRICWLFFEHNWWIFSTNQHVSLSLNTVWFPVCAWAAGPLVPTDHVWHLIKRFFIKKCLQLTCSWASVSERLNRDFPSWLLKLSVNVWVVCCDRTVRRVRGRPHRVYLSLCKAGRIRGSRALCHLIVKRLKVWHKWVTVWYRRWMYCTFLSWYSYCKTRHSAAAELQPAWAQKTSYIIINQSRVTLFSTINQTYRLHSGFQTTKIQKLPTKQT